MQKSILLALIFILINYFIVNILIKFYGMLSDNTYKLIKFDKIRINEISNQNKSYLSRIFYRIIYYLINILSVVFIIIIWCWALSKIYSFSTDGKIVNQFLIGVDPIFWALPGLFSAIFFVELPAKMLEIKYEYSNSFIARIFQSSGIFFGTVKGLKIMSNIVYVCIILYVFIIMNWYVRVTDNDIIMRKPFMAKEKSYPISDIKQLQKVEISSEDSGETKYSYRIVFNNSDYIDSYSYLNDDDDLYNKILGFLSKKTGIEITSKD